MQNVGFSDPVTYEDIPAVRRWEFNLTLLSIALKFIICSMISMFKYTAVKYGIAIINYYVNFHECFIPLKKLTFLT